MIVFTEWLCNLLECEKGFLEDFCLANHDRVSKALEGVPIYTSHSDVRHALRYDGLTRAGPRNILAYGGQLGITLEQVYYERFGLLLQYPRLPCIVRRHTDIPGETYYPTELILLDQ